MENNDFNGFEKEIDQNTTGNTDNVRENSAPTENTQTNNVGAKSDTPGAAPSANTGASSTETPRPCTDTVNNIPTGTIYSPNGTQTNRNFTGAYGTAASQSGGTAQRAYPEYSTSHVNGSGNISYAPTGGARPPRKPLSRGAIAVLVIVGMLLSAGFGMLGACLVTGGVTSQIECSDSTVIYKTVEHVVESSEGTDLTYADVEAAVGDSVVAITTEYKNTGLWQQYVTSGAGSGVVISEDGYIITNNHVVARSDNSSKYADAIKVSLKNGETYDAELVAGDANSDIAVIKIDADGLSAAVFGDSDDLVVGEEVIAIGNPLGELSGTTTNGIISALARTITVDGIEMNLLQTNAAINPGNSGGGLFNMNGELIGIVNAKSSGTGIEGLGFAIPANDALDVSVQLIENGSAASSSGAKIGITVLTISTEEQARRAGVSALGVYVAQLESGFNDDVLEVGDRIVAVNGEEISSGEDVTAAVKAAEVGDELEFAVYRNGKLLMLNVVCYESTSSEPLEF